MAELKTKKNEGDVEAFLDSIDDETKRSDSFALLEMMRNATGDEGAMWGSSIVGFGVREYSRANGDTAEWFEVGFSPRKQNLTLYIMDGFDAYEELLGRLGSHSTGKACLYVKRLEQVDTDVLRDLVDTSIAHIRSNR